MPKLNPSAMYFLLLLCYYLVVKIDQLNGYVGMSSLFPSKDNVKRNMPCIWEFFVPPLHSSADTITGKLMIQLVISKQWGETPISKSFASVSYVV